MPSSRPYVPSQLLLRSLLRPLPRKCLLARRLPPTTVSTRLKSKATKRREAIERASRPDSASSSTEPKSSSSIPLFTPNNNALNDSGLEAIEWWEQDETGKQTFVSAIRNESELREHEAQYKRLEAWSRGEQDVNEPEFRSMVIDELKKNPAFADMRDQLERMKKPLEERLQLGEELEQELGKEEEAAKEEEFREVEGVLQGLLDDPAMAEHKDLLQEMQAKLPEWGSTEHPEFLEAMARLNEATGGESTEAFQSKLAPYLDDNSSAEAFPAAPDESSPDDKEALQKLNAQINEVHDLLRETGLDPALETELANMRRELSGDDEWATDVLSEDGEVDMDKLDAAIAKFEEFEAKEAEAQEKEAEQEAQEVEELTEEEKADPELKAKVDKIMEDPRLMEKLAVIKKLMSGSHNFMATARSAPDPDTLPASELTTLQEQLKIAQKDPEHLIALRRLRINLLPPYNAHPFLAHFNEALKLAYVGANDDVRRILWRAYLKAKTIPGLLEAIPDDAWDLLWYSQAVEWKSNQNRRNHLGILLGDLDKVGRQGPPTKMQDTPDMHDLQLLM